MNAFLIIVFYFERKVQILAVVKVVKVSVTKKISQSVGLELVSPEALGGQDTMPTACGSQLLGQAL